MTKPQLQQLAGLLKDLTTRERKAHNAMACTAGYDSKRDERRERWTRLHIQREALEAALVELDRPEESE